MRGAESCGLLRTPLVHIRRVNGMANELLRLIEEDGCYLVPTQGSSQVQAGQSSRVKIHGHRRGHGNGDPRGHRASLDHLREDGLSIRAPSSRM